MYQYTPQALSASQYYTKSVAGESAAPTSTVLRVTKTRTTRRLQLSVNASYTLGICACVLGFGMAVVGIFNLVVQGLMSELAIALWGGMLGAAAAGGSAIWTFRDEPIRRERVKTTFTLSCLAMVFHLATLAMGGMAVDREYVSFHDQLFVACDRDPTIYRYDLAYANYVSANRNPSNPQYQKNCDSRYPDPYCNISPDKLGAEFSPDEWWNRNKYKVYDLYQFYRKTFRFSYGLDVTQIVLAIQLILVEIFLMICTSYVLSHRSEHRGALITQDTTTTQSHPATSNLRGANAPLIKNNNTASVFSAPPPQPPQQQQLISPAFLPSFTSPSASVSALTNASNSNNDQIYANTQFRPPAADPQPPQLGAPALRKSNTSLSTAMSASKPQTVEIEFVEEAPPPPPPLKKLTASRERLSHAGGAPPQRAAAAAPPIPAHVHAAPPRYSAAAAPKRATTQI